MQLIVRKEYLNELIETIQGVRHYEVNCSVQSDSAIMMIRILYSIIPMIAMIERKI